MSVKYSVTLSSLRPDVLEGVAELARQADVLFETQSRRLSGFEGDMLPEKVSVTTFVREYFRGARRPLSIVLTTEDLSDLSPLEALDLLYRSSAIAIREDWFSSRIGDLINSRRASIIAHLLGMREITDFFIERHAPEWFGDELQPYPHRDILKQHRQSFIVSPEKAAKRQGDYFYLHSGTNNWNRTWLPTTQWSEVWDTHLRNWQLQMNNSLKIAEAVKANRFQFLFVPERDTLTRATIPGLFQGGFLPLLLIQKLTDAAPPNSVLFPVQELVQKGDLHARLLLSDSHLSAEDYWTIFSLLMERFDLARYAQVPVQFGSMAGVGDLASKFGGSVSERQTILFDLPDAECVMGSTEFQSPMRDNHLAFENDKAPVQKSLLIMGDSHSSIGGNPFLTFIARHFFRYVEFTWNPFDVHQAGTASLSRKQFDYVLFETSQRFATPTVS